MLRCSERAAVPFTAIYGLFFTSARALLSPFQLEAGTFPFKVQNVEKLSFNHCWDKTLGFVQILGHRFSSGMTGHGYCSSHSVWMQDAVSPRDFRLSSAALAIGVGLQGQMCLLCVISCHGTTLYYYLYINVIFNGQYFNMCNTLL